MHVVVRLNAMTYPVEADEARQLEEAGAALITIEGKQPEEILEYAADCDALLVVSSKVPGSVVEKLEKCRVIARLGAGTDNIDVAEATRRGIVVSNVPDFCQNEQAEHTMALLLAWARRLPVMLNAMREANWTARHHPSVHRVAGQTLGLVGFGGSAQAVARRALAFDLRVIAAVRDPSKYVAVATEMGVELVTLERALREADFVSLHIPLTAETRQLMNAEKLALMKPSAVLINTARGALIDETALLQALKQGRVAGAALDVFAGIDVFNVPGVRAEHPFFELDNLLMTPHCAGSSVESSRDSKTRGVKNAVHVLNGYWPPFVVNTNVVPRSPLKSL